MNNANQFDEQQHPGAVKSRTHSTCLVGEPVTVMLSGLATNLCIADALALKEGLAAAIQRVQAAESILKGDGQTFNLCVLAPTRSGMSMPRSKLGDERFALPLVFLDDSAFYRDASCVGKGVPVIASDSVQS